jgi:phytoene dehydrogenase-like protein
MVMEMPEQGLERAEPTAEGAMPRAERIEPGAGGSGPTMRASDQDRDVVITRLRDAFAEGRLDDGEFDERTRAALVARTYEELDSLLTDLPARQAGTAGPPVVRRGPGRFAVALKSSVRRAGRWRVPARYTAVVYKGSGWLDLRAAELTAPDTTIVAVAYKSRITLLVPPGVHVEMTGMGITQDSEDDLDFRVPPDAPTVHIRGIAYRGTIEVSTRPRAEIRRP